jgi:hypothetical protein
MFSQIYHEKRQVYIDWLQPLFRLHTPLLPELSLEIINYLLWDETTFLDKALVFRYFESQNENGESWISLSVHNVQDWVLKVKTHSDPMCIGYIMPLILLSTCRFPGNAQFDELLQNLLHQVGLALKRADCWE